MTVEIERAIFALQQVAMAHPASDEHSRRMYQIAMDARTGLLKILHSDSAVLDRAPTDPPSGPGWYYATMPGASKIIPVCVCKYRSVGDLGVWETVLAVWIPIEQFIWFGPVPICEASP